MSQQETIKERVTGVILAGGQARRLGGEDKGLVDLCGRPMIEHSIRVLSPQVKILMISANRNIEQYRAMGFSVVIDQFGNFEGPLAGLRRSLQATQTPLLATLPCDAPLAPTDFIARLNKPLSNSQALAAIAHDGQRLQPLFALFHREVLPSLEEYLAAGGRKVHDWAHSLSPVQVDFSDCSEAFRNINTQEDLHAIRAAIQCPPAQ